MRKNIFKVILSILVLYLLMIAIRRRSASNDEKSPVHEAKTSQKHLTYDTKMDGVIKNILMWTHDYTEPFNKMEKGIGSFDGCQFSNCYVTNDREYLPRHEDWDAIMFHAPEYTWPANPWHHGYPAGRQPSQIYIFACIESSANYRAVDPKWNGYFNWTMTYRLDSDVRWSYLTVRGPDGKVIGPRENVTWIGDYPNFDVSKMKKNYGTRKKAAAWFVSNCKTLSRRETYADDLQRELKRLNLTVDVYGRCGHFQCPHEDSECWRRVSRDYYFYLAFENSFSQDYVTEKLLNAMEHKVVPIVWGGADYSRFLPPGSYVNARDYPPQKMASIIRDAMRNFDEYARYLRWTEHYAYFSPYDSPETNPFCELCEALNRPVQKTYGDFIKWWNK